jgi:hypothetical protein
MLDVRSVVAHARPPAMPPPSVAAGLPPRAARKTHATDVAGCYAPCGA